MIQPNTPKPTDLFSTSNARAGGAFAPGQASAMSGGAGNSSGFMSMLTSASGEAGRKQRSGVAGVADSKALLTRPSRVDPLAKAVGRDGPLAAEIKRAREGKSAKGGLDGSQNSDSVSSRAMRPLAGGKSGAEKVSGGKDDADEFGPGKRESSSPAGDAGDGSATGGASAAAKPSASGYDLNSGLKGDGSPGQTMNDAREGGGGRGQALTPGQAIALAGSRSPEQEHSGGDQKSSGEADIRSGDFSWKQGAIAAADDQAGKGASHSSAGKMPPPTTVTRFNQQLLTVDPRQMLLGLDTLGSRMMISASQMNQGDSAGGQGQSPTAAARSERSAAGEVDPRLNSSSRMIDGTGAQLPMAASGDAGATGIAAEAPAGLAINDNRAHSALDPVTDDRFGAVNTSATASPGSQLAAVDGGELGLPNANADTAAAVAVKLASSMVAANREIEQAVSARAAAQRDVDQRLLKSDESKVASASAGAGGGGQAGNSTGQSGGQSGGDLAGQAAAKGGQAGPGEQQQASRALAQQVERAVASASRQAERLGGASGPITLRLKPESLGQVRIKLSAGDSGQGLGVKIEVGSTDAQRLLSESMGSLRDALKAKGLVLEQGAVQVDPSLAAGTLRETGQLRGVNSQPEPTRAEANRDAGYWQRPAGDDLGRSGGDEGARNDGRGRQDARSSRGGFFDGAAILPGGARGAGINAR